MGKYDKNRQEAGLYIKNIIQILKTKEDISFSVARLTIEFQEKWGFSEKSVLNMLEPYKKVGLIEIEHDDIFLCIIKKQEANLNV